jgi:hypothetical protein
VETIPNGAAFDAEGAVRKVASTSDGYFGLKIPAARPGTLANDKVELKSSETGARPFPRQDPRSITSSFARKLSSHFLR